MNSNGSIFLYYSTVFDENVRIFPSKMHIYDCEISKTVRFQVIHEFWASQIQLRFNETFQLIIYEPVLIRSHFVPLIEKHWSLNQNQMWGYVMANLVHSSKKCGGLTNRGVRSHFYFSGYSKFQNPDLIFNAREKWCATMKGEFDEK